MKPTDHDQTGLPVVRVGEIPPEPTPRRWLIEDLWAASAVGLIGGAPKSCKSYLGLDMALSVATNTQCLGSYSVREAGPTLVYLAEDSLSVVRERTAALARHRGLDLNDIQLHVITAPRLRLDLDSDRTRLFETARRLQPRLLLLDPLVRLHRADENNATEMAQLLSGLRDLQRGLDLAVILVHHTRKYVPAGTQAGQGLRGSTDLHAFGDSNLDLRRQRGSLILSMEHRAAAAPDPVCLELATTDQEAVHLEVVSHAQPKRPQDQSLDAAVIQLLQHQGGALTRQAMRRQLAVNNQRLGQTLATLQHDGHIERGPAGWGLRDGQK